VKPPPYQPSPIDTTQIELPQSVLDLTERLARNTHDVWAANRLREGWSFGPKRDDDRKTHPCLVPYEERPDAEKQYDRNTALETVKAGLALGYRIEPG